MVIVNGIRRPGLWAVPWSDLISMSLLVWRDMVEWCWMFNPNWQWNLRMDYHPSFLHVSMGFPWLFPWVFHCRGLEPRFSQDVYRGPKVQKKWIHGESTVNRRANLDEYDYIMLHMYTNICIILYNAKLGLIIPAVLINLLCPPKKL